MAEKTIQKYDFIDALRGLAILGVVLVHTSQWVLPQGNTITLIANNGARGVQLFYVASALTLFLSFNSRRADEAHPTRNFFIRRFFRIAPMYYLGILVYVWLDGFAPRYWAPNGIQWWYVLQNFGFLHGWNPQTITSVVPGGWSIAVEYTFYLILPFLFRWCNSIKSSLLFLCISIMVGWFLTGNMIRWLLPLYSQEQQYLVHTLGELWFFNQAPVFAVGALVYNVIRRKDIVPDKSLGYALFGASMLLCMASLQMGFYKNLITTYLSYAFAFGLLTVALFNVKIPLIVNPLICWIGKLSYSIYLVHFLVLRYLPRVFEGGFPIKGNLGLVLALILVLGIASGISLVTYYLIERPGMHLGKLLIKRLDRPAPELNAVRPV